MQQETQEGSWLKEPQMFENFRFPANVPMIWFYCNADGCPGKFETAYGERHDIVAAGAHICPICGEYCQPSKMRRTRPL